MASSPASRQERLDNLPVTRKHLRLLGASGIGWALDAMDVGLIAFVMAALTAHWQLAAWQISLLGAIGFAGMALGAVLGGHLADRFGRRQVFAATLVLYGLATGASALAPTFALLVALRFIVGVGLGAELPVASTLISEFAPRRVRGSMVVLLEAFWAVGWIAAALVGRYVVSASPAGWRWAFALGCVPAVYALVVRFGMPESVRYLEMRGRHPEAEQIVRSFEASAGRQPGPAAAATPPRAEQKPATQGQPRSIWSRPLAGRTAALWTIWFMMNFAYYGAFIWIPSLLFASGYPLAKSFSFTLVMTLAQLPGYAVAAVLIERWGRRRTLTLFLAGSALAAIGFGLASTSWQIIAAGCLLSFFNLGAWGALYAIGPELYPTGLRGTGTGAAAGFGRIASIIAPLSVPLLVQWGGVLLLFGLFAVAFGTACGATLALPEQRNQELR
ncbi:MFS transporter [Buchananella hordeovulneris]|uniref:MFS transporter n=1 Tax=Buchananella hordeovulneris TaxID=52770 RepID=UPI001C9E806D|nr:MFS transporter [Buchananella hordeovulneris]